MLDANEVLNQYNIIREKIDMGIADKELIYPYLNHLIYIRNIYGPYLKRLKKEDVEIQTSSFYDLLDLDHIKENDSLIFQVSKKLQNKESQLDNRLLLGYYNAPSLDNFDQFMKDIDLRSLWYCDDFENNIKEGINIYSLCTLNEIGTNKAEDVKIYLDHLSLYHKKNKLCPILNTKGYLNFYTFESYNTFKIFHKSSLYIYFIIQSIFYTMNIRASHFTFFNEDEMTKKTQYMSLSYMKNLQWYLLNGKWFDKDRINEYHLSLEKYHTSLVNDLKIESTKDEGTTDLDTEKISIIDNNSYFTFKIPDDKGSKTDQKAFQVLYDQIMNSSSITHKRQVFKEVLLIYYLINIIEAYATEVSNYLNIDLNIYLKEGITSREYNALSKLCNKTIIPQLVRLGHFYYKTHFGNTDSTNSDYIVYLKEINDPQSEFYLPVILWIKHIYDQCVYDDKLDGIYLIDNYFTFLINAIKVMYMVNKPSPFNKLSASKNTNIGYEAKIDGYNQTILERVKKYELHKEGKSYER